MRPDERFVRIEGERRHLRGKGHNIYGGGTGYIIAHNAIYKIRNNGMDGDDWSWNNFETGGAGAIATQYPFSQEIAEILKEIGEEGL